MNSQIEQVEELVLVHVFPKFGKEHLFEGFECWCHPECDEECPNVIIHNAMN